MATPHLISDYSPEDGYAEEDNLASVQETSESDVHLVTIEQSSAWSNKTFLATPTSARWAACMATGIEANPNLQGTSAVYNDTNALINAVGTKMDSISWRTGYHPCVNSFIRGSYSFGPYSHRSGVAADYARAEYVHSAVAYRFNLHRLHFSKMSSFTASIRVYVPSLAQNWNGTGIYTCTLENAPMFNGASKICCSLSKNLPTLAADIAGGRDEWEINGNENNGASVSGVAQYSYHSVAYNPYHGDDSQAMPVWTANQRSASPTTSSPALYYHDFAITNADNIAFLKANPPYVWVTMHFKRANAFSHKTQALGLNPGWSITAWFYRADLVLSCTCAKF